MDKRFRAESFRNRMQKAMQEQQLSQTELARRIDAERSTISLLLSNQNTRLPNGQLLAEIAGALSVSSDWLLSLTPQRERAADILERSMEISRRDPVDDDIIKFYREAHGYKIRHVPTNLPDPLKIQEVLRYEYGKSESMSPDQAIEDSEEKIRIAEMSQTDYEICASFQALESFARGESIWRGLDAELRIAQLNMLADRLEELYPSLRLFLFDGLQLYSASYVVLGPLRALLFLGQQYFIFNTEQHIRSLSNHFDMLIKRSIIQPHEATRFVRELVQTHLAAPSSTPSLSHGLA